MLRLPKPARWYQNGAPTHCAFDLCQQRFNGSCYHAPDNRYYCSVECYEDTGNTGFKRIEKLARLQ